MIERLDNVSALFVTADEKDNGNYALASRFPKLITLITINIMS
ncbi:hypothetical protein [Muribaculum gordoncarteri]